METVTLERTLSVATSGTQHVSAGSTAGAAVRQIAVPRELGSVRLVREIGRGAMGAVWLARDSFLERQVAVKFLHNAIAGPGDSNYKRFLEGARAAAAFRHPALVTVYQASLVEDVPYLVMEYVDGVTLADLVKLGGPMSERCAMCVLQTVADAVALLHDRDIVHRDIKPANVLIDFDGRIVLSDFGLTCGKILAGADAAVGFAGTPAYMAPDAFDGAATPRSDIYSMGMTAYVMLAGKLPFQGESWQEVQQWHREGTVPLEDLRSRGVTPELIDIIERCVNKSPVYRCKHARVLHRSLVDLSGNLQNDEHVLRDLAKMVCAGRGVQGPTGESASKSKGAVTAAAAAQTTMPTEGLAKKVEKWQQFAARSTQPAAAPPPPKGSSFAAMLKKCAEVLRFRKRNP